MPSLINIVTVTWRAVAFLPATMASVATHKRENVRYWVVDGGSTDGTVELIQRSPVVDHWISEPDRGIYDAMNKAIALIPDGLILFLGAGDELLHLPADEELANADVVYGDVEVGARRFTSRLGPNLRLFNTLHHQGLFVDRQVLDSAPFDLRYPIFADFDLNQRLYKAKLRFKRLDYVVARARTGGVSELTLSWGMSQVTRKNFGALIGGLSYLRLLEPRKLWARARRRRLTKE